MKQKYVSPPCAECGARQVFWIETVDELIEKATAAGWQDGVCGLCNRAAERKEAEQK